MVVVSWNVNSIRARHDHVLQFLQEAQPDVLCLQETKLVDAQFPSEAIATVGYEHQAFDGQKAYNGVAILSKHPLEDVQKGHLTHPDPEDKQKRLIRATVNGVRIFNCYVPMGTAPSSPKFRYKLQWLARLRGELTAHDPSEKVVVCGDLNVALGELDTWDPFGSDGRILYHPHERKTLERVMAWGLHDTWRHLHPDERAYSWWDYRAGAFQRNHGFRIDYVLGSKPLLDACTETMMWRHTRKWKPTASDHIPVGARFTL